MKRPGRPVTAAMLPENMLLLFVFICILVCIIGFMMFWLCDLLERRQKRHRDAQLVQQLVQQAVQPVSRHQPARPLLRPAPPSHPPEEAPQSRPPPEPLQVPRPSPPTGKDAVVEEVEEVMWMVDLRRSQCFFLPDSDAFEKPPCYEDAVLMESPPPPYTAGS